ncbi:30S ribosomal protein S8 [Candidatus Roizmanbacteria bacterium RIFCSPHIGHO2_02_FULL_39_9]|uniref:Small ribosomal subunit protein uS8 n=2 Tax=Candidatus Roizmaniibacteriota TaxID=1752723 RepID=A0A1F7I2I4_9BACT|nr:MAG: 30S ribosomal protein S8 [Candidatus Roizmanbacteria bacterium RIFCSPHIGHO2_02_FULL_39_9]OGK37575.1 MAG: 30S ribosomal protein S8 [Candidatus Roizmanbacteria bacterium RIFCSPHIGHO2_12_FULL_39_8]
MNNTVIDLIIRVKNGYLSRKETIHVLFSKTNEEVLQKLKTLGFIKSFKKVERDIIVELLYKEKMPSFTDVKIFSKPGRRYYVSYKELKPVLGGLGYSLLSTSKGIMTNKEARKQKTGGELLFELW